jgi:hypothetical protein
VWPRSWTAAARRGTILAVPETEPADALAPVIVESFEAFANARLAYLRAPRPLLTKLLRKDALLFAMRGIQTADEFVEQAFAAHESSSEETMWGHAWQAAIAKVSPHTVGAGDLKTDRDGVLWIIEVKMGPQNAKSVEQDLRALRAKVRAESGVHHPGRKGVQAMYAFVRGAPRDKIEWHRSKTSTDADLDGFQYTHLVGLPFLRWVSADFTASALLAKLAARAAEIRSAREQCIADLKALLRQRLVEAGLEPTMAGVMALSDRLAQRKSRPADQSSA